LRFGCRLTYHVSDWFMPFGAYAVLKSKGPIKFELEFYYARAQYLRRGPCRLAPSLSLFSLGSTVISDVQNPKLTTKWRGMCAKLLSSEFRREKRSSFRKFFVWDKKARETWRKSTGHDTLAIICYTMGAQRGCLRTMRRVLLQLYYFWKIIVNINYDMKLIEYRLYKRSYLF